MTAGQKEKRVSGLEEELNQLFAETEEGRLETIRELMRQLAATSEERVIVSSYPACNSGS